MKLEYLLVIAFLVGMAICAAIVYFSNKEQRRITKEAIDKVRNDWASAIDARDKLHNKEADALKYALSCKDDLIAEKDKRIEQLEGEIALKDMVMACVKVDGSVDIEKLKEMVGGPYTCEEAVYNE